MSAQTHDEQLPIPGKIYPMTLFWDRWGHLIVSGSEEWRPHKERGGQLVPTVAVRVPDEGSNENDF